MKSRESFVYNPRNPSNNNYFDFSSRTNIKKIGSKKGEGTHQLSRSLPKETKKIELISQSLIGVFQQNIPLNLKTNPDVKQKYLNRSDCFQQEANSNTRNTNHQRNKSIASSISTSDSKLKSFLIEKDAKSFKICKSSLGKPTKSLLMSEDPICNQVYINSNINNINCQIIPDSHHKDIDSMSGPEDIHLVLVNVLQQQKKVYRTISQTLHQLNDGVDNDYLDLE